MIKEPRRHQAELLVIGSGLAGMAASLFALARGVSVAQVGNSGVIAFTTGYLDLLGHDERGFVDDPWQALIRLREDEPRHPLANVTENDIRAAFTSFTQSLTEMGLGYTAPGAHNVLALTPAGTLKPTLSLPLTMQPAIAAMAAGLDTLIVDFTGLNGFSAREVVANLSQRWPGLRAARIGFPDMDSGAEVYAEVLARALEVPATRQLLAERIGPLLGSAQALGLPAILGVHRPDHVHRELQSLLGVPVFEIPTMPPAVPGVRLRELFETRLPQCGVALEPQHRVKRLELHTQGVTAHLEDAYGEVTIEAAAAVLATGRFTSGGLRADPNAIRETLVNLAVSQPEGRAHWYRPDYFDPRGHAINRSGVMVDEQWRPLDATGKPAHPRLFAAGSLLAHQDWIRQRCGAGVAIATAYKAVDAATQAARSG
ncbi:MAG: glycerol-3-phosphate dehydrogenase subunit GlpB [Burkholderiales bacterium]|nr:glycerol-3-phosphate dehydrogenase subunit GlpB [Burkholderiales bacterium]